MSDRLTKIIIVSVDHAWCSIVHRQLSETEGFRVLRSENNLMAAYSSTEELKPDLVIVEDEFTELPEFKMFQSLLDILSISALATTRKPINGHLKTRERPSANGPLKKIEISNDPSDAAFRICAELRRNKTDGSNTTTKMSRPNGAKGPFVLIGTSTGGVEALTAILAQYPVDCPPTLIVQHTGEEFGVGLVNLLNRVCPANVVKASGRLPLLSGTVYLGAGGTEHMVFSAEAQPKVEMVEGKKVMGHIPSINVLFHSAVRFSQSCVAGLLTGMGKDGVDGLLALRSSGAKTFAQDESSSVVFGMPKVAWDVGAAEHQVALKDTTSHILRLVEQIESEGLKRGI